MRCPAWVSVSVSLLMIHGVGFGLPHDLRFFTTESLILAQNERWRRGLGMQVERERGGNSSSRVANG
jgi:hypothetical protein